MSDGRQFLEQVTSYETGRGREVLSRRGVERRAQVRGQEDAGRSAVWIVVVLNNVDGEGRGGATRK